MLSFMSSGSSGAVIHLSAEAPGGTTSPPNDLNYDLINCPKSHSVLTMNELFPALSNNDSVIN